MFFQKFIFKGHLDEDEELLFVAHKHWFEIFLPLLKFLVFGLLFPWALWLFVDFYWELIFLWHFIFLCWFVYAITDWYLDALLVTNASIIDIEWHGILHRTSARVDYVDLKEISYEINGIWATILNFGIIHIHLNSGSQISLENVNDPKNVELKIKAYKHAFLHDQQMTDSTTIQEIIANIVRNHISVHGLEKRKKLGRKEF